MRISDWSSDVCSSDLQRRGEQPAKQPRPPARGAQRLCHHQHREEYLPAMMVDAQRPELHENIARHDQEQRHDISDAAIGEIAIAERAGDEIGSESCRERVWQYV